MSLADLREIYGSCYLTETPDGQLIPWKQLTIGEFMEYEALLHSPILPPSIIETEIFSKCVLDRTLVNNIALQKAGTIPLVVSHIMRYSGPASINEFNSILDMQRSVAERPIHQIASLICQAFPSYTLEQVYSMDFYTMGLRLAQAEQKLIRLGVITEPISLVDPSTVPSKPQKQRPQIDPKKLKNLYDKSKASPPPPPVGSANKIKQVVPEDLGESKAGPTGETIISFAEMAKALDDGSDENLEKQMKQEAKSIYGNYLGKDGKVKIPSHEERVEQAKQRMAENRKNAAKAKK